MRRKARLCEVPHALTARCDIFDFTVARQTAGKLMDPINRSRAVGVGPREADRACWPPAISRGNGRFDGAVPHRFSPKRLRFVRPQDRNARWCRKLTVIYGAEATAAI